MAATPFDPSLPSSSFFDIYHDAVATRNPVNLPGGGCNFVDLTPGANGAKCGCRRFWSRFAVGRAYTENLGADNTVWCMCAHHACYHDDVRAGEANPTSFVAEQENEKPRSAREPLSPVQDSLSFRLPSGFPAVIDFANPEAGLSFSTTRPEDSRPCQTDQASQRQNSSLPDTLSWGDFLQSQPGHTALPPIPAQCLMPSQPSSTASSSQARYLRPFAGKGLQTLSSVSAAGSRLAHKDQHQAAEPAAVYTEQPNPKSDSQATVPRGTQGSETPRAPPSPDAGGRQSISRSAAPSRETFQHLSDTVKGHELRLDRLENVSFSAAGHDDCHEKHDQADLRVTDLEVRVEEVEKLIHDSSGHSAIHRANRLQFDESANSVVSLATNTTERAGDSSEIYSQIQSLQAQIIQLHASLPSYQHPLEMEVVFLPFPLKRVWQEIHEFKLESAASADEWTQLPSASSSSTLRSQSPVYGEWADMRHDYEWLLPKACGARSITDKRLRSRGLIRTVSIKGPDARSVQAAMHTAFGSIFQEMLPGSPSGPRRRGSDARSARFLGLQQPWVPLRKIHKDSRLRFLSPDEMITPALWDVKFLNSVSMRSSEPRLFVTHPEAYLQDSRAYDSGWSWQRLRLLSRVYPDAPGNSEVPEADALEEYWSFNEQLDEPASDYSSLSLRQARQRVSTSPSQHCFTIQSSMRSPSPALARGQSPMKERKGSRPPNIRTASMPPSLPGPFSPSQNKRRVASYGHQHRGSLQMRSSPSGIAQALKRRRTRSPTYPRNTPRWTASPSPMPPGVPGDDRQSHVRSTTPFCYATPYSNAPLAESRPLRGVASTGPYPSDEEDLYDDDFETGQGRSGAANPYDDDDESNISVEAVTHIVPVKKPDSEHSRQWQMPEDEPWPGIEDQDRMSDGENVDPLFSPAPGDEGHSEASSQPSEYPSTQRGWQVPSTDGGAGFRIHEDDDRMQNWG